VTEAAETNDEEPEPESVRVRLNAADLDREDAAAVAVQIPRAGSLAPGTRIVVFATARREGGGILRRLLGRRSIAVPLSSLCTALLVRGYVEIEAAEEGARAKAPP
jgi:hypothetical protein